MRGNCGEKFMKIGLTLDIALYQVLFDCIFV